MKSHAYRPLIVIFVFVAAILVAREIMVPDDFGTHEMGYMYGWHRKGNEQEWKDFKVKYATKDYCQNCHYEKQEKISATPHGIISCQNCHGPALSHPEDPPKLTIDRSREQCLRCHAKLPYKGSGRQAIRGINNEEHNPDMDCVVCHNPHSPGFG
jgi:hypothetical protein